jgi:hypothetical protein
LSFRTTSFGIFENIYDYQANVVCLLRERLHKQVATTNVIRKYRNVKGFFKYFLKNLYFAHAQGADKAPNRPIQGARLIAFVFVTY